MKRKILISSLVVLFVQSFAGAEVQVLHVPSRTYQTIQDAIDEFERQYDLGMWEPGDEWEVEVAPNPNPYYPVSYSGQGNWDLDFKGLPITVRSRINPDNPNWDIIASTIIDCNEVINFSTGEREPHRAVQFHSGEGPDSRLMGFTIRNGYARGQRGANGQPVWIGGSWIGPKPGYPWELQDYPDDADPCTLPPKALPGGDVIDNGYGGAILCRNSSSPTIKYCVITDCVVTGARGGDGASGLWGTWSFYTWQDFNWAPGPGQYQLLDDAETEESTNGQQGGTGGDGEGRGYGGAIACREGSSPVISDCVFSNNIARGGEGGRGGSGGWAEGAPDDIQGDESGGGDAGDSIGDGMGGVIYTDGTSGPVVVNCTLSENTATAGPRARGGMRGLGNPTDPRAPIGNWGYVYTWGGIAGGGGYYDAGSDANFSNCLLSNNQAYDIEPFKSFIYMEEQIIGYTVGGALYCGNNTNVTLNTCDFTDNLGGAVWCGDWSALTINNDYAVSVGSPERKCLFEGNSDPNDKADMFWQELFQANYDADLAYGGALCVGTNVTVDINSCHFGGNSAKADGGAIKLQSSATITDCSFGGNVAEGTGSGVTGFGGAVDAYKVSLITVQFDDCSFTENHAVFGGGFSSESFDGTFNRCYFVNNTAEEGGGMDIRYGTVELDGVVVKGNSATLPSGYGGGGMNFVGMDISVQNSTIADNSAAGSGGGMSVWADWNGSQTIRNCLITGNYSDANNGGGIACHSTATPAISNCTFSGNGAAFFGGGVFSDWISRPVITDCIFNNCDSGAIYESDGGDAEARYCLFYNNPDGDYYDSQTGTLFDGPGEVGGIPDSGGTNLYGDPLFVSGDLGGFYLSQIFAGQGADSPAVDAGSAPATSVGMDEFTTRTDNVLDSGQVDIGYHYLDSGMVATFQLTTSVAGGQGTIEPASGQYFAGTVVTLTATPQSGWRIEQWTGSDDDTSTSTSNTVIMNSDRAVSVEFDQPSTLIVSVGGGAGYYPTIQEAVNDARDGDTVVVYPGTYYGGYPFYFWPWVVQVDKSIEIRSLDPDDPATVAATIIDGYRQYQYMEGFINWGVGFLPNTDENTILNGFTIMNCGGYTATGLDGDRGEGHPDGYDGISGEGAAIFIASGGGPVIKNCVIRDNVIVGGNGGNGVGATDVEHAGRGGWSGWAWGAGVYCGVNSTAKFINCRIIDNIAQGGNGGDGGAGVIPGGSGNYGGNYSISGSGDGVLLLDPFSLNSLSVQDDLWKWFEWDEGSFYDLSGFYNMDVGTYIDPFTNETKWRYFGDYRWYTGMGGGVYVDRGSEVTFTDCEISGNLANGGMSGQGGSIPERPMEPLIPYTIPSFGGGVYCAKNSKVTFTGCTITENISSDPSDPNHRLDSYLGHGGGVCAEDTAEVIFEDCNLTDNTASVGGGLNFANANPTITDSRFTSNTAFHGGGIYGNGGVASISGTEVTGNAAILYAPDANIFLDVEGRGGGVHFWAADVDMIDCNVSNNQAQTSGGGAFFGGEGISSLFNCLITDNSAGRNGGGVTNTTFSQLTIANCTLAENTVAGLGVGGGIYSSHWSYTDIIDSIIWGNLAVDGTQVAVGTGFEHDYGPSTVSIWFSDIGPRSAYVGGFLEDTSPGGSEPSGGVTIIGSGVIYDQLNGGTGRAEVIVSLFEALDLRAETDWTDAASIAVLQSEVANRQTAVFATLSPSDFILRQQFKNQAGFSGTVDEAGLNKLLGNSLVQYIEPIRYVNVMMSQALVLANALAVRQTYDGTGVAVAIVDTGVDYRHPMLGGGTFPNAKVIGGYDTAMGDADPLPAGDDAHGTGCAGIAAGDITVVGDYIGGVAPGAKIYALKIAQDDGLMPMDAGLAAWEWCVNNRIADPAYPIVVMSNSWGIYDLPFDDPAAADVFFPAMTLAAESAVGAGITILAASGNDGYAGQGISFPSALSDVISVGAVYDTTDQVTPYSNTADILDILAPADPIHTTDIVGAAGYDPGDYYPYFNGTSAACPFGAGAVAVLQQAAMSQTGTYLTPGMVRALLVASGEPVTDTKVAITKPRVNLGALLGMPGAPPFYVEQGCIVIGWDPNSADPNDWIPDFVNYGNISEDPNFANGYYLSQVAAGQLVDSPCVDAGSDLASNLGLDTYTTRTDGLVDTNIVDMGVHLPEFEVPEYELTFTAIEVNELAPEQQPVVIEPESGSLFSAYMRVDLVVSSAPAGYEVLWTGTEDDSLTGSTNTVVMDSNKTVTVTFIKSTAELTIVVVGPGSVSPSPGVYTYPRGTVVDLTATPDDGARLRGWIGTDNDGSTALTNTVTMYADREVTVEFELSAILTVPGDYPTIAEAIAAAETGDIIQLSGGVYHAGGIVIDKEITLASTNPDDPCVVALTIIDGTGIASPGIIFTGNTTQYTVLNGITIANGGYGIIPADDGENPGDDGQDGGRAWGGGIRIMSGGGPTIKNCIIRDCYINGGDAGNGANADATTNAGRGGWGGWARGGGVYIGESCDPNFINCVITGCTATGGNGGNGGNYAEDGGDAGVGGNWSDGELWKYWGYIGDYRFYSGYGAGVYCDVNSSVRFIACNITGNRTQGGMSGIGGNREAGVAIPPPGTSYEIPTYGGGMYFAAGSVAEVIDCNISNNVAPKPSATYHISPHLGHGGGIAFEQTASSVKFENCNITDNTSSVGGGMYWADPCAAPELVDCNIAGNAAYLGGGILGSGTYATIKGCEIHDNFAGVAPNDVDEIVGQGGGLYSSSVAADIVDCNFFANQAGASGGALYITGVAAEASVVKNCLVIENEAGRDGGGLSVNWDAVVVIANCTVYGNSATAAFGEPGNSGFGGGLYCSYGAETDVIDSIFWDNGAVFGNEIAVETGFEYDPRCGTVSVSYSDVRGGQGDVQVGSGCTFNWGVGNTVSNPLFVNENAGDFHLSQVEAGQLNDSPCVDVGSDLASIVGLSLYTTRTDGVPDRTVVDMGYHYPVVEACRFADLLSDGVVNFGDFAVLASAWLEEGCGDGNNWCGGADLTFDTTVGLDDLVVVADCWLVRDALAPVPNPAEWAVEPYGASSDSVSMTAVEANDVLWGLDVQYYFECATDNCSDSNGWLDTPEYTDSGLAEGVEYGYRAKARDVAGNETAWSVVRYATTLADANDVTAPDPDPMTWATEPQAISATEITMTATIAIDPSGVLYYFDEITGLPGGDDSGWIASSIYTDDGLLPDTEYCYRVQARDNSANQNATGWSATLCATTLSDSNDTNAPDPPPTMVRADDPNTIFDPYDNTLSGQFQWPPGDQPWWHKVVADVSEVQDDSGGPIEIRFICVSHGEFSSESVIPALYRPILIGGTGSYGSFAEGWRLIYEGGNIIYDVDVDKYGGSGAERTWKICAYDPSMNEACSTTHLIGSAF